jgi:hypothetical protein
MMRQLILVHQTRIIMKKLLVSFALVFGAIGAAQAQVHFDSGSDRPLNPQAAGHFVEVQYRGHPRPRMFRCRDGARRRAPGMCRGHGGVARRY